MSFTIDIADGIARDVLRQMEETGDEDLAREVAKMLASTSVPTEEAFNMAIRVRQAETRARALMEQRRKQMATAGQ